MKRGNSKPFWSYTKEKRKDPPKTILTYDNKTLSDTKDILNAFNAHFSKSYNQNKSNYSPDFSQTDISSDHFHLSYVTENDVDKEIRSLAKNKPPGPDGIPPSIYIECVSQLKLPLTKIFNTSLKFNTFPSALKDSIVTPVPKKPNENDISGYRPISNLNIAAKIFEGILYNKVSTHIFKQISPKQHGFVNKKSTVSNLVEFTDYVARRLSKAEVHTVYVDVEKCFDRLHHDAILHKLVLAGFSKPLVTFFASYLRERRIFVRYKNMSTHNNTNSTNTNPDDYSNTPVNSSFQPIIPPSGIAQGSKLSSLLFILTYNDIHKHVRHSEILMYADDVKIFKTIQSENDCYQLQEDLDSLTRWLATIGLNFHPKKSFVMAYTVKRKRPASPHIYKINNVNLQYVDQYKDLGVTFESDLNFNIHRYEVETKGFQRLGMVHRYTKPVHDIDVIQILYQALVRSVLEYGSVLWLPHTKSGAKSLERIQARFVLIVQALKTLCDFPNPSSFHSLPFLILNNLFPEKLRAL
ncbi:hypothetical protein M8J77_006310 [Diaphorina citri]|nr:hypothetical protein M8J77_006310 [Diaphorina citri]